MSIVTRVLKEVLGIFDNLDRFKVEKSTDFVSLHTNQLFGIFSSDFKRVHVLLDLLVLSGILLDLSLLLASEAFLSDSDPLQFDCLVSQHFGHLLNLLLCLRNLNFSMSDSILNLLVDTLL